MPFVAITRDRDDRGPSAYHVQVRLVLAGQPVLQSRKLRGQSDASREAERIFGRLPWLTAEQAGLTSQPCVCAIAEWSPATSLGRSGGEARTAAMSADARSASAASAATARWADKAPVPCPTCGADTPSIRAAREHCRVRG